MARRTRSAVLGATLLEPLMVRDTVAVETRARSATAWIFICPRAGSVALEGRIARDRCFSQIQCLAGNRELQLFLGGKLRQVFVPVTYTTCENDSDRG